MKILDSLSVAGLTSLDDNSAEKLVGGTFNAILVADDGSRTVQTFDGETPNATIDIPDDTARIRVRNTTDEVIDIGFTLTGENGLTTFRNATVIPPRTGATIGNGTAIDQESGDPIEFQVTQARINQF